MQLVEEESIEQEIDSVPATGLVLQSNTWGISSVFVLMSVAETLWEPQVTWFWPFHSWWGWQ
jgi:hypothetical protein